MRRQVATKFGKEIAGHFAGGEQSVDAGLIANARLLATLLEARLDLGLAACVRSDLVAEAGAIVIDGLAHRARLLKLHSEVGDLGRRFGLDPRAFGDGGDKDENFTTPPTGLLREVANAA